MARFAKADQQERPESSGSLTMKMRLNKSEGTRPTGRHLAMDAGVKQGPKLTERGHVSRAGEFCDKC